MGIFDDTDVIASYSRAQAIEDGVLVDVTEQAKEAGFRFPVAMTSTVWGQYVQVPKGVIGQDERGRLHDILWMLLHAIRASKSTDTLLFELHVRNSNRHGTPPLVKLKSICGPGDTPEPVITIMLPEED